MDKRRVLFGVKFLVLPFAVFSLNFSSIAQNMSSNSEYKNIKSEELLEKIKRKEEFILIDCRPDDEYNTGHIPGAECLNRFFCFQRKYGSQKFLAED